MDKLLRNVMTFAPAIQTRDAMPRPGDEDFLPKLDEHYRKEVRLLLAADPGSHEYVRFFDEIERVLKVRAEVIKTHEKFVNAKTDIEHHTGNQAVRQSAKSESRSMDAGRTTDWRAMQRARHAQQDQIATINQRHEAFWADRAGIPDTEVASPSRPAHGKETAASINARNAAFWNNGGNDAA